VKNLRRLLCILPACTALVARVDIELVGVLVMPGHSLIALGEASGHPATWRALGRSFAGCTLTGFSAKTDSVTLTNDASSLRLRLKDEAKVRNARLELSGTITAGQGEKLAIGDVEFDFAPTEPTRQGDRSSSISFIRESFWPDGASICSRSTDRSLSTSTSPQA